MRTRARSTRGGFTLIELAIVMLIIGLIIAFVTVVGFAGIQQARIRATQSLISKLEMGVNERLDALMQRQVTPNGAHQWLAAIGPNGLPNTLPWGLQSPQRAQVIARIDYLKREMPDVFFIQNNASYPVNFAGRAYQPPGSGNTGGVNPYILPMGHRITPGYLPPDPPTNPPNPANNRGPGAGNTIDPYGEGIYGASYTARAALNKLIGLNPKGWNGVDDDGNGLIDEVNEGTLNGADTEAAANLAQFLASHQHVTARSETLYAILVEGQGPLGSVFSSDDFTAREVQDTDGDGLPEFVDAWGSPLQFYRWPIFHNTPELQNGSSRYASMMEPRQNFPLDPNGLLTAPAWWGANAGASSAPSAKLSLFQGLFTCLTDPNYSAGGAGVVWDRSAAYARRSYFCKFLILAPGPDQETGLFMLDDAAIASGTPEAVSSAIVVGTYASGLPTVPAENFAAWTNWVASPSGTAEAIPPDVAQDNIDNQGLQSQAGGIR